MPGVITHADCQRLCPGTDAFLYLQCTNEPHKQRVLPLIERLINPTTSGPIFGDLLHHIQASSSNWLHEFHTRGHECWMEARDAGLIEALLDVLDQPSASSNGQIAWQDALEPLSNLVSGWEQFEETALDHPAYQSIMSRFLRVKSLRLSDYERSGHVNGPGLIRVFMAFSTGSQQSMARLETLLSENVLETTLDYWFNNRLVPKPSCSSAPVATDCHLGVTALLKGTGGVQRWSSWKTRLAPPEAARQIVNLLGETASFRFLDLKATLLLFGMVCESRPGLIAELESIHFPNALTDYLWTRVSKHSSVDIQLMVAVQTGLHILALFTTWHIGAPRTNELPALIAKMLYFSGSHGSSIFWTRAEVPLGDPPIDGTRVPLDLAAVIDPLILRLWGNQANIALDLEPIWLQTLDLLLDLEPSDHGLPAATRKSPEVRGWLALGKRLGLEEETYRRDALNEELSVGLFGCNWHQCIFHGGAQCGARSMPWLKDQRCNSVQYCTVYCQKRDWHDGNHKRACQKKRAHRTR